VLFRSRTALTYDGQATLAALHIPIFAVNSDRYPVKTEAVTRHGLTFQVKTMKGHGHFLAQEDPALFDQLLEEVLTELPRGKTEAPTTQPAAPVSQHAQ
jgi:pimeloyl-ACP methyl ester carboxylesterase